jgi:hypothetical protein
MMMESELNFDGFKVLLSKISEVVTDIFEHIDEVRN